MAITAFIMTISLSESNSTEQHITKLFPLFIPISLTHCCVCVFSLLPCAL